MHCNFKYSSTQIVLLVCTFYNVMFSRSALELKFSIMNLVSAYLEITRIIKTLTSMQYNKYCQHLLFCPNRKNCFFARNELSVSK